MTIGCATYNAFTGVRLTPVDIAEDNGGGFFNGQYIGCKMGYADAIDAEGFPDIQGWENYYRLRFTGGVPSGWTWDYSAPEDTSVQITVFAKNPDGSEGQRCFGTAKVEFNYAP